MSQSAATLGELFQQQRQSRGCAHGVELPPAPRLRARHVVEAESLKGFLRATYLPWTVRALPSTTYAVEFSYDGEFDQNLVLEPDNSEASLRLLRRALGWLYPKMPYAPDGKWLPIGWLKPAAEAGLLDQCAAETGVRLRVLGKMGLSVQEELRSKA